MRKNYNISKVIQYRQDVTVPKWIRDQLPEDVIEVLKGKIQKPTTKGRCSSIDEDNINDLAYYMVRISLNYSKEDGHVNPFFKDLKGQCCSPYEYALKNHKYKCLVFLTRMKMGSYCEDFVNPFEKEYNDAPEWTHYYFLATSSNNVINSLQNNFIYNFIMDCPKKYEFLNHFINRPDQEEEAKFLTRHEVNTEKETEFFKSLSNEDKIKFSKYVGQKKISLDIRDQIEKEGNFECLYNLVSLIPFAQYCNDNDKIDEFKQVVDNNREDFVGLKGFTLIVPKFRKFYPYAYSKTKASNQDDSLDDHIIDLIEHQYFEEIKFIKNKNYSFCYFITQKAIKTLNKSIIDMMPKGYVQDEIDSNLANHFDVFLKLYELGYRPGINGLKKVYYNNHLKPDEENFDIITKYFPKNSKLDDLKFDIANNHPELIRSFIDKFGNRMDSIKPETWDLHKINEVKSYKKACQELNIDETDFIGDLFDYAMRTLIDTNVFGRDIVLYCFRTSDDLDVSYEKYIKWAINNDDLKIGAELIRHGCSPDLYPKWKKRSSNEMYRMIIQNI